MKSHLPPSAHTFCLQVTDVVFSFVVHSRTLHTTISLFVLRQVLYTPLPLIHLYAINSTGTVATRNNPCVNQPTPTSKHSQHIDFEDLWPCSVVTFLFIFIDSGCDATHFSSLLSRSHATKPLLSTCTTPFATKPLPTHRAQ